MPYIKQTDRAKLILPFDSYQDKPVIAFEEINTAGEIQYAIALIIKSYLARKGLNYQHCNDVLGALSGAQMEFYRRTLAPYEDSCIERNGDV